MCHTLNLCLKTPVEKSKSLSTAIPKVANIVSSAKQSSKITEYFKDSSTTLVSRCVTRWNTNFSMIRRAAQFPWVENGHLFKPKDHLPKTKVEIMIDFVLIMESFEMMFKTLQSAELPSVSRVVPTVRFLKLKL